MFYRIRDGQEWEVHQPVKGWVLISPWRFHTTTRERYHSFNVGQADSVIQTAWLQVDDLLDQMKSHIAAAGFKDLGLGLSRVFWIGEMHGHCQIFFEAAEVSEVLLLSFYSSITSIYHS